MHTSATSASSAPSTAAIAPTPVGAASCISCPRRRTRCAPSFSESAPAATSAVYSPRLCPASSAGAGPPCCCHARHTAMPAASSAGWVYSVRLSISSGPPCDSAHRSTPAPSEASSNVSRTIGCSSDSSASMPTDCEPWPGNTKARCVEVTRTPCVKTGRDDTGEPAGLSVPGRIAHAPAARCRTPWRAPRERTMKSPETRKATLRSVAFPQAGGACARLSNAAARNPR